MDQYLQPRGTRETIRPSRAKKASRERGRSKTDSTEFDQCAGVRPRWPEAQSGAGGGQELTWRLKQRKEIRPMSQLTFRTLNGGVYTGTVKNGAAPVGSVARRIAERAGMAEPAALRYTG